MMSDVMKPGDKIDIHLLHQNSEKVYKSSIFDPISETELEIGMPTESGKMILFQVGLEGQFYFYTEKGIFTCEGVVKERYKKDNFYLLSIKLTSPLKRFQRRDYFRVDCYEDFYYYAVPNELNQLKTTEELFDAISDAEYIKRIRIARMQDLSGGGIRFIADEEIEAGTHIAIVVSLKNEKVDKTFYLITEIVACNPMEHAREKRMIRGKFLFKDPKDRELIIKYVFEEDRCRRKKENG